MNSVAGASRSETPGYEELQTEFEARPIAPGSSGRFAVVLRKYGSWAVLLVVLALVVALRPKATWLPGLMLAIRIALSLSEAHRRRLATRKALAKLQSLFSESGEPDLADIFSVLDGVGDRPPMSSAHQWSERYQRGMITRSSYYSGMRKFLQDSAALPGN